ncbi:MAG: acyl carrier protein [Alphaproteobacteria bacterium]|nr:acyl carrier protein [Alphaproteobacteria bacterium]
MASTFETVAEIIAETTDVELDDIKPESHVMKDLAVDSLAFLDITFEIDQRFKIKVPIEDWMQKVNQNEVDSAEFFVVRNLCKRIDELAAQSVAA